MESSEDTSLMAEDQSGLNWKLRQTYDGRIGRKGLNMKDLKN